MSTATPRHPRLSTLWMPLLCFVIASCATSNGMPGDPALLAFLEDGVTTRDEVMLRLGQPSATFQAERILTYRVGETKAKFYFIETPSTDLQWQRVRYSLVLIFDASDTLEKHSLVSVQ